MGKNIGVVNRIISKAVASTDKRCLFYDRFGNRCKCDAIQSHSIQKGGAIAAISENGHVLKIGPTLNAKKLKDFETFERIGVNKASTFLGFCNLHDTEVFAEIEAGNLIFSDRVAVIFAIRAIALELYRKKVMVELQAKSLDQLEVPLDLENQLIVKYIQSGASQAVQEGHEKIKQLFSFFHKSKSSNFKSTPSNFLYQLREFNIDPPFTVCGAFEPDLSLDEKRLFRIDPLKTKWNSISFFCGSIGGRFYFFAGGFQKFQYHRIDEFLKSISKESDDFISKLFTISVAFLENCFVRESWIKSLSQIDKGKIRALALNGVRDVRDPKSLQIRLQLPESKSVKLRTSLTELGKP